MILAVFVLSFGVTYQANLFPNAPSSWGLLKNIVYLPYWQMYGELFLENIEGKIIYTLIAPAMIL
jgi:transient receptor potential cation channel subfamily M protein 2